MQDFSGIGLPDSLLTSLNRMQYNTPTPIQVQAIPLVLAGKDILGSAQTGTGKTAAFSIPLIARLMGSHQGVALILSPTRELATQIMEVMRKLIGPGSQITSALLIGGEPIIRQFRQLKARPRIIVGTPGRINDHIHRGSLKLQDTQFLVLDETDRMLDMGFGIQLDEIVKHIPQNRQTLMFSATLPQQIILRSQKYLRNPERITVGPTGTPTLNIEQRTLHLQDTEKYSMLLKELDERNGSVIVFVNTKRGAEKLAGKLYNDGHEANAIHGDLRQRQRDQVIKSFRNRNYRIMVATDVAARGLDIPHIEHVINYDVPQCPEDYVHRIGRTARAGRDGRAISFVIAKDRGKWRDIEYFLNPNAARPAHQPPTNARKKSFSFRGRRTRSKR
jgi:ATP-dependent RNA helicase DeaD